MVPSVAQPCFSFEWFIRRHWPTDDELRCKWEGVFSSLGLWDLGERLELPTGTENEFRTFLVPRNTSGMQYFMDCYSQQDLCQMLIYFGTVMNASDLGSVGQGRAWQNTPYKVFEILNTF